MAEWHIRIWENVTVALAHSLDVVPRFYLVDWHYLELLDSKIVHEQLFEIERFNEVCAWCWIHKDFTSLSLYHAPNPNQAVVDASAWADRHCRESNRNKFDSTTIEKSMLFATYDHYIDHLFTKEVIN
jgi:hypothetical protein